MTTITSSKTQGFEVGDRLVIITLDRRWWMRLWHFVMRKPAPLIHEYMTVSGVTSDTTLNVQE